MINIVIPCTPNYNKKGIPHSVKKTINVVDQFFLLYNSIKKNWTFDYKISLFYNKKIPFNNSHREKISKLDVDVYGINPDCEHLPYGIRCGTLTHKLKNQGSHRLFLECDTIALAEPKFDLSRDWQAMYAGSVNISKKEYSFINEYFGYNIDLDNKIVGALFLKYIKCGKYDNFFPHFNGGAYLIREELCPSFKEYAIPSYYISKNLEISQTCRHIGVQYGESFSLVSLSENWKPFDPGFNFLAKSYDINKFGKNKISLLHYCGTGGYEVARRYFGKEIEELRRMT